QDELDPAPYLPIGPRTDRIGILWRELNWLLALLPSVTELVHVEALRQRELGVHADPEIEPSVVAVYRIETGSRTQAGETGKDGLRALDHGISVVRVRLRLRPELLGFCRVAACRGLARQGFEPQRLVALGHPLLVELPALVQRSGNEFRFHEPRCCI